MDFSSKLRTSAIDTFTRHALIEAVKRVATSTGLTSASAARKFLSEDFGLS